MVRILVQLLESLKAKLDAHRKFGTSASSPIRHLLEQHFKKQTGCITHNQGGTHGRAD